MSINTLVRFQVATLFVAGIIVISGCSQQASNSTGNNESGLAINGETQQPAWEFDEEVDEATQKLRESQKTVAEDARKVWESGNLYDPVDIVAPAGDNRINILAWNVESDGNNPQVIAKQLQGMKGYQIFALSEVRGTPSFELYVKAIEELWGEATGVLSETGREDRLMFVFDPRVFDLIKADGLDDLNPEMKYRSPHALTLKHKPTDTTFIVMNNHLARGNEDNRLIQADGLREWARAQTLPVIAVGDYNFDYVFETEKGNREFVAFMRDGIWKWIKPEEWIDSNWYDQAGDGDDDYPGSLLDFAFVAGPATEWKVTCKVLQWEGDFPDDDQTADHRPVELSVDLSVELSGE